LTVGQPQVTDIVPLAASEVEALGLAAALEQGSEHPLARAVLARNGRVDLQKVVNFSALPGRGISGQVADRQLRLGSPEWLGVAADQHVLDLQRAGKTVVVLAEGDQLLALLAIADALRPTSRQAVERLRAKGIRVVMLTGDNAETAASIAAQAGIAEFRAGILPADKAAAVTDLRGRDGLVAMVGDGINDAPALAAADVSFAIGAGSDAAVEAADLTLIRSDLNSLVDAIELSHATLAKIRQNLFFAFIYNVLGIPLAAFGMLNPVFAGAAMAMSSVSVVSNSLLLKRWRPRGR
jgi:Cu+-exporting ATPase